jgi:hypothetical protein
LMTCLCEFFSMIELREDFSMAIGNASRLVSAASFGALEWTD